MKTELVTIYEDNHLLVINKPPGMLVQGDATGDLSLIDHAKHYIKRKYDKPGNVYIGLPHRIDRPTSGIVVLAKTSKALSRLNKQFSSREPEKSYWAIVKKPISRDSAELIHYLKKNQKKNKSFAYDKAFPETKKAILHYKQIAELKNYIGLSIDLATGRHHQIRCQLATIGNPIKGDLKYGFPRSNPNGSIHLHARNITLIHPVKKEKMSFQAEVPDDVLWKEMEKQINN